jgi:hypothetical protein
VHQRTDRPRLTQFLDLLGRRLRRPTRFYLVDGSVLIDLRLRPTTLDIAHAAEADEPIALSELEEAIRSLRQQLDLNIEPASPADFLPVPASALSQSQFVRQHGPLSVYYYLLPTHVIAKVARGSE